MSDEPQTTTEAGPEDSGPVADEQTDTAGQADAPEGWVIPDAEVIEAAPASGADAELPWPAPEEGEVAEATTEAEPEVTGEPEVTAEAEPEAEVTAEAEPEAEVTAEPEPEVAAEATSFDLPAQADIRFGADIQDQCRAALDGTGDVQIGCEAVERIDGAVLQCLGALNVDLQRSGRRLQLVEPSESFSRSVDLLGFGPLLDPTPATAS
jgi:anti-anti-sigma regulatory factor